MSKIVIRQFTGEIPKDAVHLLPDGAAQEALNCDFTHGDLRPIRAGKAILPIGFPAKTVYSDDGKRFIAFPDIAQVHRSPVSGDVFQRFYFTDSTGLKVGTFKNVPANGVTQAANTSPKKVGVKPPKSVVASTAVVIGNISATVNYKRFRQDNGVFVDQGTLPSTFSASTLTFQFSAANIPNQTSITELRQVSTGRKAFVQSVNVSIPTVLEFDIRINFNGEEFVVDSTLDIQRFPSVPGGMEARITIESGSTYKMALSFGVIESVAFAATQQNQFQEESAPTISNIVDVRAIDTVTIKVGLDRDAQYVPIEDINIYKTVPSGAGFVLAFSDDLAMVPVTPTTTNTESIRTGRSFFSRLLRSFTTPTLPAVSMAGEVLTRVVRGVVFTTDTTGSFRTLTTERYLLPPEQLDGLQVLPNGYFAAYKGDTVYFCEPFRPHAWPYSLSLPHDITAMHVSENQLVAATKSNPYVIIGSHPDSLSEQRLPSIQAATSETAITNYDGMVTYASRDGLVAVSGTQSSLNLSQMLFTREDWRKRYDAVLDKMQLTAYDGRLIGTNPITTDSFIIRLDEKLGAFTRMALRADGTFTLPITDSMYYSQDNMLYEFGAGDFTTLSWWSKEYILAFPISLGAGFIHATGEVTLEFYNDRGFHSRQVVSGITTFRIKSGLSSRRWSVKIITKATVRELLLAESMRELQNA